ncbi:copper resistance protein CopZ [Paenibacillus swuensis]|uniref:Copper resistance protein CopZ n=1 Tax=Paenibacillus swuensis TaxID=1178515 RepID=A0A172TEU4_9BACL|nr:copper ion binding protein [Paenibacillus swuensis]ANE45456.1 copper resistance protein CopZ [Paenibacillus swuensis]
MQTVKLKVEGMSCNHCVNSVEKAVKEAGATATVDLASNTVSVEFEESKVTLETIKEAIEEQGYDIV